MARKDISDLQVCQAYKKAKEVRETTEEVVWPDELLANWTGEPMRVCERAAERAAERGYLDYGTALYMGWLTDKGKEMADNQ